MKFQLALVSILSAAASIPSMALSSQVCVTLDPIKMQGDAKFVGSDPANIAIGDEIIGTYSGVTQEKSYPNQSRFNSIDINYTSVCIVTALGRVAPTCNYDFQMSYCRTSSGECVNGSFSAYGKGPSKIKVTGGIDDLFAATGQIETTTAFNPGAVDPVTGDLSGSNVDMRFELCYGVSEPFLTDFGADPAASELPLGLCEGECDNDKDCREGLICFQRRGLTPVPGCSGVGLGEYDYCIPPAPGLLIDFGADPPASKLPLGLCEGECDTDNDCEGDLICFQRSGLTPVPGCLGDGLPSYDYCIEGANRRKSFLRV